jgi:hypothetical protein
MLGKYFRLQTDQKTERKNKTDETFFHSKRNDITMGMTIIKPYISNIGHIARFWNNHRHVRSKSEY